MARVLKYLLWLLGAFVALFALAAIALTLFFDPNDFREEISTAVREQTGRELTIDGDISLELFPWLAVEVGKASLGNAPGFGDEPMASFDRASFSVRLLPAILRQEVVVGAADIESLRLNLKVDKRGNSNWSDLVPEDSGSDVDSSSGSGASLNVNSVEIVDARFSYTDESSGDVIVVEQVNLGIGKLTDDGSPVPVEASLNFDVQPAGLAGDMTFNTVVAFDAESGKLQMSDVVIDGAVEGVASTATSMSVRTDGVDVMTKDSTVALQALDLRLFDMHVVADVQPFSYAGELAAKARIVVDEFSPRSVMQLFDVEPPVTADPSVLSRVALEADAALSPTAIDLSAVAITLDDTSFSGSLSVPRSATGFYELELVGDAIDLGRYMEPAADGGESSSSDTAAVEIPADLIAPLNARGKVKLTTATLGDIVFENIDLGLNAADGKLRLFPVSSGLFGGTYNGDVRIDVSGSVPRLSMNEKIEGIDLARLAKAMFEQDNVTGTINGSFALVGSGSDMAAIQRSLAGNMSMLLSDGTYEGTDLWYELRRARAVLKSDTPPEPELPAKTAFSTVRVSGVVTDGVMRSDDLFAELPFMQLTGRGSVDLVAASVDYSMSARIIERPEFLPGATPEELDEFTEAVIPLKITGPLASPSIKPDLEKLLQEKVEEEIEDLLKDKLKGLFD